MVKTCPKCKIEKNITAFGKHSKTIDKLQIWCKECRAEKLLQLVQAKLRN